MNLDDIQYVASGGTFLFVAVVAVRILLKLQLSSEQIYERRATEQVATIRDLETHERSMRKEMAECHKERVTLIDLVTAHKVELAEQKIKLAALEAEVKLLKVIPMAIEAPKLAENVTVIKDRQIGQIVQTKEADHRAAENADEVKSKLDQVLNVIEKGEI